MAAAAAVAVVLVVGVGVGAASPPLVFFRRRNYNSSTVSDSLNL
jgi:hypothetical protein